MIIQALHCNLPTWSLYFLTYEISKKRAVVQLSQVRPFVTPWTAACQASCPWLSPGVTLDSCPLSMMPFNHLILCHPLLLPSVLPSIRVFSSELALHIRWPKYWGFSFSISPSNEYWGLISFRIHLPFWRHLENQGKNLASIIRTIFDFEVI